MDADASTWTIIAGANRWALYALMLFSAGSALFLLITPTPERIGRPTRALGGGATVLTAAAYVAAIGLGGAEIMAGGLETLLAADTWVMGASTSLGLSAAWGVPGMLLLWAGFTWHQRALLGIGLAAGIFSFLLTGHAATANPVWIAAPAVAVHLLGAAYWVGALFPLDQATRDLDPITAGTLLVAFSQRALWLVFAVVATGLVISWIQLGAPAALVTTSYGFRLMSKIALFMILVALAAYNKFALTPQITSGGTDAAARLRKIIRLEYVLLLLVSGAAASLTLTEPPRALGHKSTSNAQETAQKQEKAIADLQHWLVTHK